MQQRFRTLDSWRGICALLVIAFHLSLAAHLRTWLPVQHGDSGVDFFFVLSGFVIAHASFDRLVTTADVWLFLVRRLARIYPLHLLTLASLFCLEALKAVLVTFAGVSAGEPPFTGSSSGTALFANLLLVNGLGFFELFTWNVPSWSISAEFYTYLVFALVTILSGRRYPLIAALIACSAIAVLATFAAVGAPLHTIQGGGLLRCVGGFFLGTLTYQAYRRFGPAPARLEPLALFSLGLIFFGVAPSILHLPMFALLVYFFAADCGVTVRALRGRGFVWLGEISFSIYLIHFPVLTLINAAARVVHSKYGLGTIQDGGSHILIDFGGPWMMDLASCAVLLLILGLGTLSHLYFETSAQRWVHRRLDGVGPDAARARMPETTRELGGA